MVEITWVVKLSIQLHWEPIYHSKSMDSYMTQERSHLSLQALKKGHTYHTREVITSKPYCHKLGSSLVYQQAHQTFSLILFYSPEAPLLLSMIDMTMSLPWLNRAVQVQPSFTSVSSSPAHGVTAHCPRHSTV